MEDQTVVDSEMVSEVDGEKLFNNADLATLVISVLSIVTSFYLIRRFTKGTIIKGFKKNQIIDTSSEEMK